MVFCYHCLWLHIWLDMLISVLCHILIMQYVIITSKYLEYYLQIISYHSCSALPNGFSLYKLNLVYHLWKKNNINFRIEIHNWFDVFFFNLNVLYNCINNTSRIKRRNRAWCLSDMEYIDLNGAPVTVDNS